MTNMTTDYDALIRTLRWIVSESMYGGYPTTEKTILAAADALEQERVVRAQLQREQDVAISRALAAEQERDRLREALESARRYAVEIRVREKETEDARVSRADASADRNYIAGLNTGFQLGYENNHSGLAEAIAQRRRGLLDARAALARPTATGESHG